MTAPDPGPSAGSPDVEVLIADLERRGSIKWTLHPGTIGAAVAESDLGIAPAVRRAFAAAAAGTVGYLPPASAAAVADATAHRFRGQGWAINPAHVRLVPDVVTAFELTLTRLTRRPDSAVIVPTPAYRQFLSLPALHGRRVLEVPLDVRSGRPRLDPGALADAFAAGGELLVLCTPHNPLGTVLGVAEMRGIAEIVHEHGGRVFADEIHSPLVFGPDPHRSYASVSALAASHTVTAMSPSKGWNIPAAGCAQVVLTAPEDRAAWRAFGSRAAHAVSAFGAAGAIAAYTDSDDWLKDAVARLRGIRDHLGGLVAAHLPLARVTLPDAGYLAYLDLRAYGLGDADLGAWFRERARVSLSDGSEGGRVGAGHARLVFATPEPVVTEMIERMSRALDSR